MILAINAMQEICAQDSLSIKMNQIDEYREELLSQKDDLLCVKFPLNMYNVDENSCYIDYEKPDTIYYYFQDSNLVFKTYLKKLFIAPIVESCAEKITNLRY